jgi:hypothetical protein
MVRGKGKLIVTDSSSDVSSPSFTLSPSHFTSFSLVLSYTILPSPTPCLPFPTVRYLFCYGSKGHIDGFSMISLLCQLLLAMRHLGGMIEGSVKFLHISCQLTVGQ